MTALATCYTPEEFEEMSGTDGYELVDGYLREKKMGFESGSVIGRIVYYLNAVVIPNRLGEVASDDAMYLCFPRSPRRVRKPDVSFILRQRILGGRLSRGITRYRPDLAVEVISPNDEYEEVDDKVADYFDAGVPLIWVVSPKSRTVLVYHPDGTARRLVETHDLTADPVIPGFQVKVAELFPDPPEPPAAEDDAPPAEPPAA